MTGFVQDGAPESAPKHRAGRAGPAATNRASGTRILPEIQALRALAVMFVVLFHLWPLRFTGGYVGVDVFFVISGFLITSHLVREAVRSGRISLAQFWARRVRRLIPASFLVLAVSVAGVLTLMPQTLWKQSLTEIGASALYFQNWLLALDSVDYFAEENLPTPVQHYWSLSAEEQFYLVWPVLILALIVVARKWRPRARNLGLAAIIGVVFLASLAYSIHIAATEQSFGYFSTLSHAWEFAAGGLLALAHPLVGRMGIEHARAAAAWLGWLILVYSGFAFTGGTPFPGSAALLPVAGVVLVIAAGTSAASWGPDRLVGIRPIQFVGDISYSLYLWHWPPIVLLPFITGRDLTTTDKFVILAAAILLAALSKRFVEDSVRSSSLSRKPSPRTFLLLFLSSAVVVTACAVPILVLNGQDERARVAAEAIAQTPCNGAAAMLQSERCDPGHTLSGPLTPAFAKGDATSVWLKTKVPGLDQDECPLVTTDVRQCDLGDPDSDTTIALVGDSHALVLIPPLLLAAERNGWRLKVYWRSSCRPYLPNYGTFLDAEKSPGCTSWKQNVVDYIAAEDDVDVVLTTGSTRRYARDIPDAGKLAEIAKAFSATWAVWARAGKSVLVIPDMPLSVENPPDCIAEAPSPVDPCSLPVDTALRDDPIDIALRLDHVPSVRPLDLTGAFCDAVTCHFVVGGLITHRDEGHITTTFSISLSPFFERAIIEALR